MGMLDADTDCRGDAVAEVAPHVVVYWEAYRDPYYRRLLMHRFPNGWQGGNLYAHTIVLYPNP